MFLTRQYALPLLVLTGFVGGCRSIPSAVGAYERSYTDKLRLSAEEEKEVVARAGHMGVTKIETIETFFAQPGQIPVIRVKEAEALSGRVVSYRTIAMHWKISDVDRYVEGTKPKGPIVASQPNTFEENLLKVGEKEFRVTLGPGVTPTEAEAILDCFLREKIRFIRKPTPEEEYGRSTDFGDPRSIRFDEAKGLHVIAFGSLRMSAYFGTIEGDVFVVHKVVTILGG